MPKNMGWKYSAVYVNLPRCHNRRLPHVIRQQSLLSKEFVLSPPRDGFIPTLLPVYLNLTSMDEVECIPRLAFPDDRIPRLEILLLQQLRHGIDLILV